MLRVARFLRAYLRAPAAGIVEEAVEFDVGGAPTPATLLHPAGGAARPGWVVLHGITVPGRRHPALLRFARALARAGATVLIPEVEPWRRLHVDPAIADATIASAARFLAAHPAVSGGQVAVMGFSFGATQALVTAAHPELREVVRTVVGFGGYCDMGRTLRFMMLGQHEWDGRPYQLEPDPYGRWIVAGNYLTAVPELAGMRAVADGALRMAAEAGRRGVFAGSPELDPLKEEIGAGLAPEERTVWALIAAPAGVRPPPDAAAELADRLLEAALRVHPALDPRPVLPQVDRTVVLAHGRADRLIPFSESLRLREHLERARVSTTVTRLFAHSGGADALPLREYPLEALRYLRLLSRALRG